MSQRDRNDPDLISRTVRTFSRRRLLLVGGGALVLAACAPPVPTATPAAKVIQPVEVPPGTPASSASKAGARAVKHAMGEANVPVAPQRVIVLDTGELDSALALGVKPIGAVTWFQDGGFQEYLKPKTDGIKQVGTIGQPNLESVAALKPDLILSSKMRHEAIYDKLAQIAPTVFTERVGVTWKENLKLHASALNKSADAEQLMQAYTDRLTKFKDAMGDRLATTRVSIIRSYPDHIRLYQTGSFIGTILKDAGLPRPPSQDDETKTFVRATRENIPDMDGDVIFVLHPQPEKGSQVKELLNDPLWKQLKAVRDGKVFEVPDDTWALGIGIMAANVVIDDLFRLVAPDAAAAPTEATRLVKHAMGETDVPSQPRRVVVLDTGELDMALALGVKPVGAVSYSLDQEYPSHIGEQAAGIPRVGTVGQPNLEAIAALKPDLILSSKARHEKIFDQLGQIAPTVFSESLGVAWKDAFAVHAHALGKVDAAERVMGDYDRRLDEFKKAMGDRLATTRVSVVRSFPDHIRIYMKASFIGTILQDAGLPRPAPQDKDIFMERATEERIPDLDGDVIFLLYYDKPKGEQLSKLMKHPLWAQLQAVKNERVHEMNDDIWGLGLGPLAARIVVDDLFTTLVT